MADKQAFLDCVSDAALAFPENKVCRHLVAEQLTLQDFHAILRILFHQTQDAAVISALAAANCPPGKEAARELLLSHANATKGRWRLILDDLAATGYHGPDPRDSFPHPAAQPYIAFNFYLAHKAPVARLGVIAVLQAISSSFSENYSAKLFEVLGLRPEQVRYFHEGRAAPPHSLPNLFAALDAIPMSVEDWRWMCHAAVTSGRLYRTIYDAVWSDTGVTA